MYLDAIAAAALADDLRRTIGGARVQAVLPVDKLSIGFELFAGRRLYLTLSADGGREGLRLSEERVRRGETVATPLALAARARLVDSRLRDVEAPRHERIIHLHFQGAEPLTLIAELMGRMSNLILVDHAGTILGCARLVTAEMTSARVVLPGRPYQPPPAPPKVDPDSIGAAEVAIWLDDAKAGANEPVWSVLVSRLRGISPLAAREITFRASGAALAAAGGVEAAALATSLAELRQSALGEGRAPSIARRGDAVIAWAPYALTHLGSLDARGGAAEIVPVETTLEAVEQFESARSVADSYGAARASIAAMADVASERLSRRRDALKREADAADPEIRERLKLSGELLLSWHWQVPDGAEAVDLPPDGVEEPPRMRIALDPTLSAVENAQDYFKEYKRAGRANVAVHGRLERVEAELATLEQWRADLELAEDRSEIDAVHDALVESGWVGGAKARRTPRSAGPRGPLQLTSFDGLTILVGRNSRQNEVVTFSKAVRTDLWLHVRNAPGAHVVIKLAGREAPEGTILEAASFAAWYSRERDRPSVAVAVTEVKHVSRMRGGGPGMVHYRNERTINVAPKSPEAIDETGS